MVFLDDDGELGRETMEKGVEGGEKIVLEVAGNEIVGDGSDKNC